MEVKGWAQKVTQFMKKNRYAVLILLIGIALMLIPFGKTAENNVSASVTQPAKAFEDPTEDLTALLSKIKGVGKVQVMLTRKAGEKTVYHVDQNRTQTDTGYTIQVETVIVTNADRSQAGLVQQILAPEYRGAVVVCQGADDPAVKLAVMDAVKNITGLGYDRISVLKMK